LKNVLCPWLEGPEEAMVRPNAAAGKAERKFREGTRSGWAVAALLAIAACSGAALSGCAGLANTTNASPAPQETIQITPTSIAFPSLAVGQKASQTATLTNTGNQTVVVTQVALSSAEFVASGIATPLSLGPGQSAKFQVSFTSSSSGSVSGTLSAMTSHGGGSSHVKLTGQAAKTATQLSLSATSLNFGNVLVNGNSTQNVTLKNSGLSDLQITQIAATGNGFSISGIAVPVTIPGGQSLALQAKYSPSTAGTSTGTIAITSDASNPTANVALSGNAVAATYTMSLAPSSLNFGSVNVGSSATQNVQLSNTGNSSVTVTKVAATGAGISVSGMATPITIGPAQSATLAVKYSPLAGGATSGSVTVTNDKGVNAIEAVTGSGVQAGISLTPSSASFGSVVTGSTNSQTIQIKNNGSSNLTISQATVTGTGFSVSGLTLPLTLTSGQAGNFNVQYAPQAAGNVSGAVTIVSNAPNSPATVALSGTGVAASYTIAVSPSSLSFGSVTNGSSTAQGFTVTNTGNSNVAISGFTPTGAGYSIVSGSGAVTLSPNQSTSVSVQFAPTVAGTANGSVKILSNATGTTSSVMLSGTGTAPVVQHSVALNWGASGSSVAGYNVYRSGVSGSAYVKVNGSLVGGVSYADSGVQSGQTYFYVATSVDASGNESVYSNEVSALVP
jgi:hypothetical protein